MDKLLISLAKLGLPPLRQYWQDIRRYQREVRVAARGQQKARDKGRRKCNCDAFVFPHRPGSGLCRWPDPPLACCLPKQKSRPYRKRYCGLRKQLAQANNLHPIRDRELIDLLVPRALTLAKQGKQACPRMRYREVEIIPNGISIHLPGSGPEWHKIEPFAG